MSPSDQKVSDSSNRMPKSRSSLRDRLARAIAGPPRIPTSSRPFEASVRTPARNQRHENKPPSTAAPAPTPAPAPPSGPRRPAVARQRTTRSRQERLYAEAPPAADNGRSVLLATFGSTLSDLDDDDDDNGGVTATPEERPTPAPMPDIASLHITGPAALPPAAIPAPAPPSSAVETHRQVVAPPPPARPPSAATETATAELAQPPLPTPPPTPPASPGYFTRPQPTPAPTPPPTGYFTQPAPPPSSSAPPPSPPAPGPSAIPGEVLRTIPWERIPPGRRYRHQALGHRIVVKHQLDGSWYIH
ncbi:basic proline-rich protein-like [Monomorium pharaonis]|uniref:basic proline-rich protein-like n=1 Tax=Monomorium pharaonis TaxID=307658 RepID=UPI00174731A0|nr:basic proline-rich protein-like [Monomorium pharaonis]